MVVSPNIIQVRSGEITYCTIADYDPEIEYTLESSDASKALAVRSKNLIAITGVAAGSVIITLSDGKESVEITVSVSDTTWQNSPLTGTDIVQRQNQINDNLTIMNQNISNIYGFMVANLALSSADLLAALANIGVCLATLTKLTSLVSSSSRHNVNI